MSQDDMDDPHLGEPELAGVPSANPSVVALQERLGITFVNPEIALAALTHKSFVNEHRGEALQDNERLEFLGDAVLDLAVSQRLMERFPEAREGELSKIRAAVVDEAGLAFMARELDLGSLLRLGRGEELTGGRQKSSLLADAMEAVIAALYLGGGLDPALALLDRFLAEAFARAAAGTLDRDYKTQLQELAQSRMRATPRYRVVGERGPDHSKVFEVELEVRGEAIGRGEGRSKKDAEQAAAKRALEVLGSRAAPAPGATAEATGAEQCAPVEVTLEELAVVAPVSAEAAAPDAPLADEPAPVAVAACATVVVSAPPRPEPPGEEVAVPEARPARRPAPGRRRGATTRKVKPSPQRRRAAGTPAPRAAPGRRKPAARARARKPGKE